MNKIFPGPLAHAVVANWFTGCRPGGFSDGCLHCWALLNRILHSGHPNPAISAPCRSVLNKTRTNWNGKTVIRQSVLDMIVRRRKRTVFLCGLVGDWSVLPARDIDRLLEIVAARPQHTFLTWTKDLATTAERVINVPVIAKNNMTTMSARARP